MTRPEGWDAQTLADFIELQRGFDLPHRTRRPGSYKVLSSGEAHGWHDEAKVMGPGFVVGRATNIGRPTWSDEDFWPLNTTLFVKDFRGNDPKFAYYWFVGNDLSAYNSGSVQPMLNRNYIANVPIDVPPTNEQRAIAATLGALDDKIESNRRAVASISDLIDAHSDKHGAELPAVRLGDIATSVKDSVNPSKLGDAIVDHFSLPAFDSGARPERVAASTIMSNKLRVSHRAILLSRLNPRFNRTWWASAELGTTALASTEFLVLTVENDLKLAAVWLAIRDRFFREELLKRVTGTSGSHQRIRHDDVLSIEVPDFSDARRETKKSMLALLRRAEVLRTESDRLTTLRDVLLPELLSGRIRVPAEGTTP